ncbi:hypothetical protein [Streptomyces cyaneogriseus]|uniref:hypothetical protein n=1 Tax=Streptomyces cyaneogriseus TaxID=68192 RepID=UPI0005C88E44|nr:hypothetical protein [Streptomyces cyaneogriseus]
MAADLSPEDLAAMRAEGDLLPYLISLTGRTPSKPKPAKAEQQPPGYHIRRPGAWPCGTAATGPTPPPCTHQGDL